MPDENNDFDNVLGQEAEPKTTLKSVADTIIKKAKVSSKVPTKVVAKTTVKKVPVKAAPKTPAKAAPKTPAKAVSKTPVKASTKDTEKKGRAADGSRRGERTGEYSKAVTAAFLKLKSLRAGTSTTTRELAEKHQDLGLKPWAFKAAALRLAAENGCKFVNKDRINTVTRL